MSFRVLCVSLVAGALIASTGAMANPSVKVDGVTIDGVVSSINSEVGEYFGIPYATAARWTPPHAHAALINPFDASHFSTVAVCPQLKPVVIGTFTMRQSEDCLSLNVFVPLSAKPTSKLPVFFWIHGGALQNGTGVEYNAANMIAANNIVVVTINYRLGALGWLAQKALRAGSSDSFEKAGDAGNYGLMDQQLALQWVKKNIAAFGGDPAKVTIGGQSAGGLSVSLNLASTTTGHGLFRGAIIESGAFMLHDLPSQATYESQDGNKFVDGVLAATGTVQGVKCSSLTASSPSVEIRECLDGATVATILDEQQAVFGSFGISPDFGTLVLPNALQAAFSTGRFNRVPVMQGTNANEGRWFEPQQIPFPTSFSAAVAAGGPANYALSHADPFCGGAKCTYVKEINLYLAELSLPASVNTPSFAATLASADYPLKNFPDPYLSKSAPSADEGLGQILTDLNFACNAWDADTDLAKFVTVYAYELDDPQAPPTDTRPAAAKSPNDQYGYPTASEHGAELQLLFDFPSTRSLSGDEQELEGFIQSYWANFVKNLNPHAGAIVPPWPAFKGAGDVQALVPGPEQPSPFSTFRKEHFCATWEPIISKEAEQ